MAVYWTMELLPLPVSLKYMHVKTGTTLPPSLPGDLPATSSPVPPPGSLGHKLHSHGLHEGCADDVPWQVKFSHTTQCHSLPGTAIFSCLE